MAALLRAFAVAQKERVLQGGERDPALRETNLQRWEMSFALRGMNLPEQGNAAEGLEMLPELQEMNPPPRWIVATALEMNPLPQEKHLQLWAIVLLQPDTRPLARENGLPARENTRASSGGSTLNLKRALTRYSTLMSR